MILVQISNGMTKCAGVKLRLRECGRPHYGQGAQSVVYSDDLDIVLGEFEKVHELEQELAKHKSWEIKPAPYSFDEEQIKRIERETLERVEMTLLFFRDGQATTTEQGEILNRVIDKLFPQEVPEVSK